MSFLPKVDLPTYNITLPVSNTKITFRPYLVKEQKILNMAKESGDKNSLVEAILQVLTNCTTNNVNISDLPITDTEFYFYNLRARSESEIVKLRYKCESKLQTGAPCHNIMEHDLNLLTDLEIFVPEVSDKIEISETVGIKLKHQKFEKDELQNKIPTPEEIFQTVAKNVDFIYDENSQYDAKDIPLQHIIQWISELPAEKYKSIENFFMNEPKIIKKLNIVCNKCGANHTIIVEDIFDFFI